MWAIVRTTRPPVSGCGAPFSARQSGCCGVPSQQLPARSRSEARNANHSFDLIDPPGYRRIRSALMGIMPPLERGAGGESGTERPGTVPILCRSPTHVLAWFCAAQRSVVLKSLGMLVLRERIELSTSPLPRLWPPSLYPFLSDVCAEREENCAASVSKRSAMRFPPRSEWA